MKLDLKMRIIMDSVFDAESLKRRMEGVLASLSHELSGLRTGRASTSLLDPIKVESYGSQVPLNQVANITAPEPRLLCVSVWDKGQVSAVDRAIRESRLNLNPIIDGMTLRIPLPELNEERRRELVKIAQQYAEQARIAIRHVRRDGMEHIKKVEKSGSSSKDDSHVFSEQVQSLTDAMVKQVDMILGKKEAEIMQV